MELVLQWSVWGGRLVLEMSFVGLNEGGQDWFLDKKITEFHTKVKGQHRCAGKGMWVTNHPPPWKGQQQQQNQILWSGDQKRSNVPPFVHIWSRTWLKFKFSPITTNSVTSCFVLLRQNPVELLNATWEGGFLTLPWKQYCHNIMSNIMFCAGKST